MCTLSESDGLSRNAFGTHSVISVARIERLGPTNVFTLPRTLKLSACIAECIYATEIAYGYDTVNILSRV
jgi:hypothetical protein